jgi:hypothetical protein
MLGTSAGRYFPGGIVLRTSQIGKAYVKLNGPCSFEGKRRASAHFDFPSPASRLQVFNTTSPPDTIHLTKGFPP